MNKLIYIKYLENLLGYLEYNNSMGPFPQYDTEYVNDIKQEIEQMKNSKEEYDEIPVASCRHCNNIHIRQDEFDNDICMNCGSVNELKMYDNMNRSS